MKNVLSNAAGASSIVLIAAARGALPWLTVLMVLSLGACASSSRLGEEEITQAVREVMAAQVRSWNKGDLDAFMTGYTQSEMLRFASGGQVHYGWDATLARYRDRYPDRAAMGTLAFSELDITVLSPDAALVFGRWRLERAQDTPGGLFTLVFRRTPAGWRIVHDHTSRASD